MGGDARDRLHLIWLSTELVALGPDSAVVGVAIAVVRHRHAKGLRRARHRHEIIVRSGDIGPRYRVSRYTPDVSIVVTDHAESLDRARYVRRGFEPSTHPELCLMPHAVSGNEEVTVEVKRGTVAGLRTRERLKPTPVVGFDGRRRSPNRRGRHDCRYTHHQQDGARQKQRRAAAPSSTGAW